jgi:UMF1 family MFS transporter
VSKIGQDGSMLPGVRALRILLRQAAIRHWVLYDWAESAFATTIMVAFFPVLLTHFWSSGNPGKALSRLGVATSLSAVVVALGAPLLGALADRADARTRGLAVCAGLGILSTAALDLVGRGQWLVALTIFSVALVGYSGGNAFYNSLLPHRCRPQEMDQVSCTGYAAGYLGGGLLFAGNIFVVSHPAFFGMANRLVALRFVFADVAVWWALFALPLLIDRGRSSRRSPSVGWRIVRDGWNQFRTTFREVRKLRQVSVFLLAYWCYIDGINTIIRMAVSYGLSLGFPSSSLIVAILLTQAVAFPATFGFAWIGRRTSALRALSWGIGIYVLATLAAVFMTNVIEFYALAGVIGLVQGGTQALSRSLYARLIPREKSAEFFGFYGTVGKFSAILGPLLVALTERWSGNARVAIGSIVVLFVVGAYFLHQVDWREGEALAGTL